MMGIWIATTGMSLAAANDASKKFWADFARYSASNPAPEAWLSANSPWAFALHRQFDSGLTVAQRYAMNHAAGLGQCEIVASAQMRAFISQNFFYRRIFFRQPHIVDNFIEIVLPRHAYAMRR